MFTVIKLLSPSNSEVQVLKTQWLDDSECRFLLALCKYQAAGYDMGEVVPVPGLKSTDRYAFCLIRHSRKQQCCT